MNNYLEHADKVKYIDGLIAHSQEWQWFIDLIYKTYDIHEINSWHDYENISSVARAVFNYFIKILEVSDKTFAFPSIELAEIWEIARYYIGSQTLGECSAKIETSFSKLMLFCIWVTKLRNASHESEPNCTYDIRILTQKNYFQIIDIDPYLSSEEALLNYAEKISIDGFDKPISCLKDNLACIEYPVDITFFTGIEEKILTYDALSFQSIAIEPHSPWQEIYLLDMLKVSISNKKLVPMCSFNNKIVPDFSLWQPKNLYDMKKYFHHKCADFLIDTVLYIMHGVDLPHKTKCLHLDFLTKAFIDKKDVFAISSSSSFKIISMLFESRNLKDCQNETSYLNLLKIIHEFTEADIKFIIELKNSYYPISKEQRAIVNEFYRYKYKQIGNINKMSKFDMYLTDPDIPISIDTNHLLQVHNKFNIYISSDDSLNTSCLFYKYMVFLLNVNAKNQIVDKRWVHAEMIRIQSLWQNNYYMLQTKNMQTFSNTLEISTTKIIKFSEKAIANPIFFAQQCIACSTEKIIEIMQSTSEHPFMQLVSRIALSPVFPNGDIKIQLERHDIDNLLKNQIKNLLETKGYKFLNILPIDKYIFDIHENYKIYTRAMSSFFVKTSELYNIVQAETDIELLPFSDELNLGMLTQLFPVLEIKIREFATMFGIFPFKKNLDEFMQHNDPSSLLREILLRIYDEQESFENVPDLLFVYNIMYNSNSLNVRNECIHGRDYLSGSSLKFAFTVTLFAIYMITFRINTIKDNVSDILELS